MQSVPFSTNGSAHLELRYPGEGLPQLPAVEKFSKRKQLVGIVQHLSVDGTGADHPLFAALFELVTVILSLLYSRTKITLMLSLPPASFAC